MAELLANPANADLFVVEDLSEYDPGDWVIVEEKPVAEEVAGVPAKQKREQTSAKKETGPKLAISLRPAQVVATKSPATAAKPSHDDPGAGTGEKGTKKAKKAKKPKKKKSATEAGKVDETVDATAVVDPDPLKIMSEAKLFAKIKGLPLYELTPELVAVVGTSPMTRTDVVTKMWAYIKLNDLQAKNADGKLTIRCDKVLMPVFQKEHILASDMSKGIKRHIGKKAGYVAPAKKRGDQKRVTQVAPNANAPEWTPVATNQGNSPVVKDDKEPGTVLAKKKKRGKKKKGKQDDKRWWASMTDEIDPISLEPLSELKYPPFEIVGDDGHKHYFDGQCLASYMVSTSQFLNPMNREPLKTRDCQRLDAYLRTHRLRTLRVNDAFNLVGNMVETATEDNSTARALQREAAALMSAMFLHRARSNSTDSTNSIDRPRRQPPRRQGSRAYDRIREEVHGGAGNAGLRVFDDDSWLEADPFDMHADFPSIEARSTPPEGGDEVLSSATSTATAPPPLWGIKAGTGRVPIMRSAAEFPAMPTAPLDRRSHARTTPRAWGQSGAASANLPSKDRTNTATPSGTWARGLSAVKSSGATAEDNPIFARPQRLRLNLKKKSAQPAAGAGADPGSESSSTTKIFGEARPKEVGDHVSTMPRDFCNEYGGRDGDNDPFLCPYSSWMLVHGRSMGQRLLCQLESTLRTFVHAGAGAKVMQPALPPMPVRQRAFVHEYCQNHWGLSTASIDPEPNRRVQVMKAGEPMIPRILLSRAVLLYSEDLARGVKVEDRPPKDMALYRADAGRIGIWGIHGPGETRVTQEQVHSLFGQVCRQSEYTLNWVYGHDHVVVEFAASKRARKAFSAVLDMHGSWGPVSWKVVQWWPAPLAWASQQLNLAESKRRTMRALEKERKRAQAEMRRREEEFRKREEEQRADTGPVKDGWFDSEEEDSGGGGEGAGTSSDDEEFDTAVQEQIHLLRREKESRTMRKTKNKMNEPMKMVSQKLTDLPGENAWNALLSDSEDEAGHGNANRDKWWKSMTETDPISLEPLGSLAYPPFELIGKDNHSHYFDGFCLACYMVSSLNFMNPLSREELTERDCERLDEYLWETGLKRVRVQDAFRLRGRVSATLDMLQQSAMAVMTSVFSNSSKLKDTESQEASEIIARNKAYRMSQRVPRLSGGEEPPSSLPIGDDTTDPVNRYAPELDQLGELGFLDRDKNIAVLMAMDGDLGQAIDALTATHEQ